MNHGIFQDGISYSDFARFLEDVWNPHLLNKILENEIFMMRTRYVFSVTFLMNCQLFLRWLLPVVAVVVVVDLERSLQLPLIDLSPFPGSLTHLGASRRLGG